MKSQAGWRSVGAHGLAAALIACGIRSRRDAGAALVRTEVTEMTGCYDDTNGPCVRVTLEFSNHTAQPITVDGYRIAWPNVPYASGFPEVGKSVPDVRFRLEPGAVESRSVRVPYLGIDLRPLKKEDARIEILDWH
jgi:hypothetical protein